VLALVTLVHIRGYEESRDGGVLEFLPDRTRVHVGSVHMPTPIVRDRFPKLFLPDGLWLAVSADATVGAILVGPYHGEIVRCVAVYGTKVDVPCRRQGIGSMLMQKANDFAQSAGLDQPFVETKPDDVPALALFRKCGYRIFESKPSNVRLEKYCSQQ
jgi:ribosomal protein S18 acetylase RimI-like enzyme